MARTHEIAAPRASRALLALALVSGVLAAILIFVALSRDDSGGGRGSGQPAVTTAQAVVANRDIPARSEITADMVKVVEVPGSVLVKGAFTQVEPLLGETTRYPIAAGEQLTNLKVGPQAETDGLAFVVPKGKRAVSVRVDQISGVGGLLLPGDRVDVIVVLKEQEDRRTTAVTFLTDIEVLAVAQKAQEPVPAAAEEAAEPQAAVVSTSGQPPEDAKPQPDARTVTLAVTPEQAQLLALAQEAGRVYLTLRHFGDAAQEQPPAADLSSILGR